MGRIEIEVERPVPYVGPPEDGYVVLRVDVPVSRDYGAEEGGVVVGQYEARNGWSRFFEVSGVGPELALTQAEREEAHGDYVEALCTEASL